MKMNIYTSSLLNEMNDKVIKLQDDLPYTLLVSKLIDDSTYLSIRGDRAKSSVIFELPKNNLNLKLIETLLRGINNIKYKFIEFKDKVHLSVDGDSLVVLFVATILTQLNKDTVIKDNPIDFVIWVLDDWRFRKTYLFSTSLGKIVLDELSELISKRYEYISNIDLHHLFLNNSTSLPKDYLIYLMTISYGEEWVKKFKKREYRNINNELRNIILHGDNGDDNE